MKLDPVSCAISEWPIDRPVPIVLVKCWTVPFIRYLFGFAGLKSWQPLADVEMCQKVAKKCQKSKTLLPKFQKLLPKFLDIFMYAALIKSFIFHCSQ